MTVGSLAIGPLLPADLPAALGLSTRAGWGQLREDWERLLDLWPRLCLAGRVAGNLAATATVAQYGATGWVGMILVEAGCRGQGIGGAVFDAALRAAVEAGIATTGLDATDFGRPVCLKRGFVDRAEVRRWLRPAGATVVRIDVDVSPLAPAEWPSLLELDCRSCGVDRAALLRHLAAERDVCVLVARDGPRVSGFAFARPGRIGTHAGPVVANDLAVARRLLASLCAKATGSVLIDSFKHDGWDEVLEALGFKPSRRLMRMSLGPSPRGLICGPNTFAAAGLELG